MISAGASEHFKVYPNPLTAEKDLKVHPISLRRYLKDIQLQHLHQAQVRRASLPCKTLVYYQELFPLPLEIAGLPPPSSSPAISQQTAKLLMVGLSVASLHTVRTGNLDYCYYYYYSI